MHQKILNNAYCNTNTPIFFVSPKLQNLYTNVTKLNTLSLQQKIINLVLCDIYIPNFFSRVTYTPNLYRFDKKITIFFCHIVTSFKVLVTQEKF